MHSILLVITPYLIKFCKQADNWVLEVNITGITLVHQLLMRGVKDCYSRCSPKHELCQLYLTVIEILLSEGWGQASFVDKNIKNFR